MTTIQKSRAPRWALLSGAALIAVAAVGACGTDTEKKSGVVDPGVTTSTTVGANAASSTTATTAKATTTSTAAPTTTTTRAVTTTTVKTVSYANCSAVKAAGAAPIRRGDPGYSTSLDRDGDGIACET